MLVSGVCKVLHLRHQHGPHIFFGLGRVDSAGGVLYLSHQHGPTCFFVNGAAGNLFKMVATQTFIMLASSVCKVLH